MYWTAGSSPTDDHLIKLNCWPGGDPRRQRVLEPTSLQLATANTSRPQKPVRTLVHAYTARAALSAAGHSTSTAAAAAMTNPCFPPDSNLLAAGMRAPE